MNLKGIQKMIVQPKVRGFICTTAHPKGCAQHVQQQIDFVKSQKQVENGPKKVLVIGSSNGYGLSSRIAAAFGGSEAATIGVFFEKESDGRKTATAGWYNSVAFEQKAHEAGLYAKSFNGDAFSNELKQEVIDTIKKDWGSVDMVVYSLASPRRKHPDTGEILKPIGPTFESQSVDVSNWTLERVTIEPANEDETRQTEAVMGGEDWEMWIDALDKEGLLGENFKTVAYSYIGPRVTKAVYRQGTIGRAKDHLEATAKKMDERLKAKGGTALISVNKALVTQSSSAIPVIPLYFVLLKQVMKAKGVEENCIQQIHRMLTEKLYVNDGPVVDESGFIRMDDWELREDVQEEVERMWPELTTEQLRSQTDVKGYDEDFMKLFGFGLEGVNYDEDVEIQLPLPSTVSSPTAT